MSQSKLKATQVLSLVVMVAAIVIGWIAYHNYQPKLLERYGLNQFSFFLVVAQALILIVTPPIAGYLGDKYRKKNGQRFRIISLGVGFAAMIFMTVALGFTTLPANLVTILLPILVVFWLIAMNIFTSPAISTFELITPFEKQPIALAVLTLTAELLYALEPVIVPIIDAMGGAITFLAGGVLVTIAGLLLRKSTKSIPDGLADTEGPTETSWGEVIFAGIRLGIPTALVFNVLPDLFHHKLYPTFPDVPAQYMVSGMLGIAALVCLPMGKLAQGIGIQASQRLAFTVMLGAAAFMIIMESPIATVAFSIVFAVAFSMQSVSALPHALNRIAGYQKVLGVGIFFAGVEIPNAMVEIYYGFMATR